MFTYRLIAVTAGGTGFDHSWGDSYEVEAGSYLAAEADVLGREGTSGTRPYVKIVTAWVKDGCRWVQLPPCDDCRSAVAQTEWAGSGRLICWECCNIRQGRS